MSILGNLTSNATQHILKAAGSDNRDAEGAQDPKMAILSVGALFFIFLAISYAAASRRDRISTASGCNCLQWFRQKITGKTEFDYVSAPGNCV